MTTWWRGYEFDQSSVDKLKIAESWIGVTLVFAQGSYHNGSLSGGTHSGGGAVDVNCIGDATALKIKKVHYLRACFGIAWHRPYNWDGAGGAEHIHCIELHNPNLSSAAQGQVTQWYAGDNGLASHNADSEYIDQQAGRPLRISTPKPAPKPPAPAGPTLPGDDVLLIVDVLDDKANPLPSGVKWPGTFLLTGGVLRHVSTDADLARLKKAGVPVWQVTYQQFKELGGK